MPPPPLQGAFVAHLTSFAGLAGHWLRASEALARIGGPDYPQWQVNSLHQLLAADQVEEAAQMLERFEAVFDERRSDLLASINPLLVERATTDSPTPPAILARLSEISSGEELDRLAEAYAERLGSPAASTTPELLDELRDRGATRLPLAVAHRAISRLGSEPGPPPPALVAVACRNVDQLPAEDQRLLAAGLAVVVRTHLDQAPPIADQLMRVRSINASAALDLVGALVDAESAVGDPDSRRRLLAAANAIRGPRNSRATKLLRKRLEDLQAAGDESDRELASTFLSLVDP